jgi:hypothetical protein
MDGIVKGKTVQVVQKVPIVPAPSFYSSPATRGRTQVEVLNGLNGLNVLNQANSLIVLFLRRLNNPD